MLLNIKKAKDEGVEFQYFVNGKAIALLPEDSNRVFQKGVINFQKLIAYHPPSSSPDFTRQGWKWKWIHKDYLIEHKPSKRRRTI